MPWSVSSILICFTEHAFSYIWLNSLQLCIGHSLTGDDIMRVGDVELILWELILWHQIDIIGLL